MKKVKLGAFLCALAIGISTTGCADTSWVLKDGDNSLPTGVYVYYLLNNANAVQYYSPNDSSASSSAANSSSGSSSDIWSKTIEGENAATWAMNNSLDSCKELLVVERLCKERNVKLESNEKTSASSAAAASYSNYTDLMKKNDISLSSIQRIANDSYLEHALFDSYYSASGDKAVPDSEIDKYYTDNYVHVKQIFIAKFNTSTYQSLSDSELAAAKKKAQEAYEKAKADPKSFDTYVEKYNEDQGMKSNPNGYIFSRESAENSSYDTKFTDLAFKLKDGEVGMTESDMGYFIEYKIKTDPTDTTTFTASMKESVLQAMKGEEFENLISEQVKKITFTKNDKALNRYSPKNLKIS